MKILVTGATGFVGANLVHALVKLNNDEVFVMARKTSGFTKISDIKDELKDIVYVDLADRNAVFDAMRIIRPDVVYHIATYGGFPGQTDKDEIIRSNLVGTVNLLDAAVAVGTEYFVNTGSSSEYGIKDEPMKESDLCEPLNFYGVTKLAATNYCTMVGRMLNYKVCTLRLFSPYGPLEDKTRLYPSIKNSLEQGERPKLSRPNSVRDFIPIEKVIAVYLKIINVQYSCGEIINVGSGEQQTIAEFYKKIATTLKVDVKPIWGEAPPRQYEPERWEADITKLKSLMGCDF